MVDDSISEAHEKIRDVSHIVSSSGNLQNEEREDGEGDGPFMKCLPPSKDGEEKRKRVFLEGRNSNSTLAHQMKLPGGDTKSIMDGFMNDEMESDMFELIVWPRSVGAEFEDMATADFRKFGNEEALSLGTDSLCGCTVPAIVSRKGDYMAHYYKGVSFVPQKVWINHYGSEDKCFDDHVRAYIMRPNKGWKKGEDLFKNKYEKRWDKIRETVGNLVPKLKDASRWEDII